MSIGTRQRWVVLGALLLATLTAAAWVSEDEKTTLAEAVGHVSPASQATEAPQRSGSKQSAEPMETLQIEKLRKSQTAPIAGDPFAARSWRKRAPAARPVAVVAAPAPPAPPPPPSAPPLPYTYMGKLVDDAGMAVFLVAGDRNLVVRQGETIDATYHLDSVSDARLLFTHLPTGIQQSFPIGEPQ
ncbi:MAG: hypothetical protein ACKVP2_09415 [Burkholderiales bacterium]